MSDLVRRVKEKIHKKCQVRICKEEGCSVGMPGGNMPRVLVDMNCKKLGLQSGPKRCDYIFIGSQSNMNADWVVPIELKGKAKASKISRQLQAGAKFAETKLLPNDVQVHFRPIAAHAGKAHKIQNMKLKKQQYKIKFRGKEYEIKLIRCGSPLEKALR